MIAKFLNGESKSISGAAIVIAAAGLVSDCAGVIRDRILAHNFGAGPVMDAYYAAFKIPDLIYNLLIVGALTAGFIPTFTKIFQKNKDKTAAWLLANNVINILGVMLVILCSLGMIFTPLLTKVIAPGFVGKQLELATTFTRLMFLSPFFLGISMVMGGILQSLRQFILYSIAPILYNVGIILGATLLIHTPLGTTGLAAGVVLGAMLHASIQIYGAYSNGFRWRWYFKWKDAETRLIGKLMVPRTLGLAITQLNAVVITMLASLLPAGSVSVYNYANNLQSMPIGLIGIPFALAVFPVLSSMAADNDDAGFIHHLGNTTRQVLFLVIPSAIIILLLRAQIVRVILGSGRFDWTATITTANALAFFALGLLGQCLVPLYARAFYALSNTKTPFTLGVISELVSIIAALVLMRPLGVAGLALAASIGATLNGVMLIIALRRISGSLDEDKIIKLLLRAGVATVLMGIIVQLVKNWLGAVLDLNHFVGILTQGALAGLAGLIVYAGFCYVLKVDEMIELVGSLKSRWLKFRNVAPGIDEAERLA